MNFIDIFSDSRIPIIVLIIGTLIIVSDFIELNSFRKVTLKQRTKKKRGLIYKLLNNTLIKFLHKSNSYNKLLDKIQYNMGYFSSDSEVNNRKKADKFIIKVILFNIVVIGFILLRNELLISKLVSISVFILFQYLIINTTIDRKRNKLREYFPILVREFIEGYTLTNNVRSSFEHAVKEIHPVYKVHVNRLITQLNSTSTIENAFNYFSNRVGDPMCSNFVSLVQSAYSTKNNVLENLIEFQSMLNKDLVTDKGKKMKLKSFGNNIMLWIVALIVEIYIVGNKMDTITGNFFFTTMTGQNLLLMSIVAIIIALVSMKIADSI